MSHNYTNPAFCQQSEFYSSENYNSPAKIQRNELTRSYNRITTKNIMKQNSFIVRGSAKTDVPPKLGPKPHSNPGNGNIKKYSSNVSINGSRYGSVSSALNVANINNKVQSSGKYALVPVEEIPTRDKDRYAILPMQNTQAFRNQTMRIAKSQDNLDRYSSKREIENQSANLSDQFCSLPPTTTSTVALNESKLKSAFSTDFGSKSFVLYDQKSMQRYAVVPTEANEELVDDNHEIIQMHNGKVHRYAVIPAEEEDDEDDETCLSNENIETPPPRAYSKPAKEDFRKSQRNLTPQRLFVQTATNSPSKLTNTPVSTPKKNPIATQMLHDLLSTPQKHNLQRQRSTPRNSPHTPKLISSTPKQKGLEFTPQKLHYDQQQQIQMQSKQEARLQQADARNLAVISPRLLSAQSNNIYGETTLSDINKTWQSGGSIYKSVNASATIGAVSLMLILCGFMNSGLSLYMTSKIGREYYLDIGIISGFAAITLGFLGFRSRKCDWLPNRNFISGYILVTVFSLFNCCGLLILMTLNPMAGTPLNDVTTGIILGISSLILLLTSLGVITTRLCQKPPPDNRVDVY